MEEKKKLSRVPPEERLTVLDQFREWVDTPMLILAALWLGLIIIDFVQGLNPALQSITTFIWILFILEFILELTLAPDKLIYLRRQWLTMISLFIPALRILRIARAFRLLTLLRTARGIRLVTMIGSVNRAMNTLRVYMKLRGFGYVAAISVIVTFLGAAGMLAFERVPPGEKGLNDYGDALWWTAMIMTTLGSDYWPKTGEGRILCFILASYSFTVISYFTAFLATFFIGRDASPQDPEATGKDPRHSE